MAVAVLGFMAITVVLLGLGIVAATRASGGRRRARAGHGGSDWGGIHVMTGNDGSSSCDSGSAGGDCGGGDGGGGGSD